MDTMEAYRSPPIKSEPRWGNREDMVDRAPVNDVYRRRSPGKILTRIKISSIAHFPCTNLTVLHLRASHIMASAANHKGSRVMT